MEDKELSPKTVQLYELLVRCRLNPTFGKMNIGNIREEDVRKWRTSRLKAGPKNKPTFGPVTVARHPGADRESSPERPVLSVAEVYRIAT